MDGNSVVDFMPLVDLGIKFLVALVALMSAYALKVFKDKTGIEIDAGTRVFLDGAIKNGTLWAAGKIREMAEDGVKVDVKNEMVALVAQYVNANAEGGLKRLGVSPESLERRIEVALGTDLNNDGKIG